MIKIVMTDVMFGVAVMTVFDCFDIIYFYQNILPA